MMKRFLFFPVVFFTGLVAFAQPAPKPAALSPEQAKILGQNISAQNQAINAKNQALFNQMAASASAAKNPASQAPASQNEVQRQKFVADVDSSSSTIKYFEGVGAKKDQYYGMKYAQPAPGLPNSASNDGQLAILAPQIAALRRAGVAEGKIELEINRLTPVQFKHWAETVLK